MTQMNTTDFRWQRGLFYKFFAVMKFQIGGASPVSIQADEEFEYDGTILKYAGMEISQPALRGAIKSGWASPYVSDGSVKIAAVQPVRNVAKSLSVNKDLNRVQRSEPGVMSSTSLDEETVLHVTDRQAASQQKTYIKAGETRQPNAGRSMSVSRGEQDSQNGVVVGRVRSAAKLIVNDVLKDNHTVSDLENRQLGRPEMFNLVEKEGVTIKSNLGKVRQDIKIDDGNDGVVVAKVKNGGQKSVEGIEIRDTSNIRNKTAERSQAQMSERGMAQSSVETVKPEVKKTSTNKSKSHSANEKISTKVRMARRYDPSFPSDWLFEGKMAERLERVNAHGPTPEFLDALYAAEGDQFRKVLEREFPKQFSS